MSSQNTSSSVRAYFSRAFLALCVIGVGVGYLGNVIPFCPWTDFTIFFPGWQALFLIIPAICGLIRHPFSWFWPIVLLIGVLIVLSKTYLYSTKVWVAVGLAGTLVLIGIRILLEPLFRRVRRRRAKQAVRDALSGSVHWANDGGACIEGTASVSSSDSSADGNNTYKVQFGEKKVEVEGDFSSATMICSFGALTVDLRRAVIRDCAVIDIQNSFGETTVILPANVHVEMHKEASFAEIDNRDGSLPDGDDVPTIFINAVSSFGEINIK